MWEKVLKYKWFDTSGVYGLELLYAADKTISWQLVLLYKDKKELLVKSRHHCVDVEELKDHITEDYPVVLVVNGRKLLHKSGINDTAEENFKKGLPHVQMEDFYMQQVLLSETSSQLTVIRKDHMEGILQDLEKVSVKVSALFLGPWELLNTVMPLLPESKSMVFRNHQLGLEDFTINKIVPGGAELAAPYVVAEDTYNESELMAFAAAFAYIAGDAEQCDVAEIKAQELSFRHKRFFLLTGKFLLGFFLIVLLANVFVFSHYDGKKKVLETERILNQGRLKKLDELRTTVKDLKNFTQKRQLSEQSRLSFYADQLALYMPADIKLIRMDLHPEVKKKGRRKAKEFESGKIIVEGQSLSGASFDLWNSIIRDKDWVASIKVNHYQQERTSLTAAFTMEIKLK